MVQLTPMRQEELARSEVLDGVSPQAAVERTMAVFGAMLLEHVERGGALQDVQLTLSRGMFRHEAGHVRFRLDGYRRQ